MSIISTFGGHFQSWRVSVKYFLKTIGGSDWLAGKRCRLVKKNQLGRLGWTRPKQQRRENSQSSLAGPWQRACFFGAAGCKQGEIPPAQENPMFPEPKNKTKQNKTGKQPKSSLVGIIQPNLGGEHPKTTQNCISGQFDPRFQNTLGALLPKYFRASAASPSWPELDFSGHSPAGRCWRGKGAGCLDPPLRL